MESKKDYSFSSEKMSRIEIFVEQHHYSKTCGSFYVTVCVKYDHKHIHFFICIRYTAIGESLMANIVLDFTSCYIYHSTHLIGKCWAFYIKWGSASSSAEMINWLFN